MSLVDRFDEPQRAAAQRRFEHHPVGGRELAGLLPAQDPGLIERRREMTDRILARPRDRDAPGRSGIDHQTAVQRRDQSGPHERRLAAARRADHRQKAAVPELPEQVVDLLLASEEQVVFVGLERTEPGERIGLGRRRHSAQAPLAGSSKADTNGWSASGARPSHWGSSRPSCVRNCSFSGVRGPMRQMPTTGGGVVRP